MSLVYYHPVVYEIKQSSSQHTIVGPSETSTRQISQSSLAVSSPSSCPSSFFGCSSMSDSDFLTRLAGLLPPPRRAVISTLAADAGTTMRCTGELGDSPAGPRFLGVTLTSTEPSSSLALGTTRVSDLSAFLARALRAKHQSVVVVEFQRQRTYGWPWVSSGWRPRFRHSRHSPSRRSLWLF